MMHSSSSPPPPQHFCRHQGSNLYHTVCFPVSVVIGVSHVMDYEMYTKQQYFVGEWCTYIRRQVDNRRSGQHPMYAYRSRSIAACDKNFANIFSIWLDRIQMFSFCRMTRLMNKLTMMLDVCNAGRKSSSKTVQFPRADLLSGGIWQPFSHDQVSIAHEYSARCMWRQATRCVNDITLANIDV